MHYDMDKISRVLSGDRMLTITLVSAIEFGVIGWFSMSLSRAFMERHG